MAHTWDGEMMAPRPAAAAQQEQVGGRRVGTLRKPVCQGMARLELALDHHLDRRYE